MKLLASPNAQRDNCGVGFIAGTSGIPSHDILTKAIESVGNLTHRGAVSADGKTGDGAGILTQIPRCFSDISERECGQRVPAGELGVGMLFLPTHEPTAQRCRAIVEEVVGELKIPLVGWRSVPIDPDALGEQGRETMPNIQQVFLSRPDNSTSVEYERLLYLARMMTQHRISHEEITGFSVVSLSHLTVVYKGLFIASQLPHFYPDLARSDFATCFAIFHQRYSTNTSPTWALAQPCRTLAHNGEINTVQANRNWMRAREGEFQADVWGDRIEHLIPVIEPQGSDSLSLDNALELLTRSGRDIRHALMMLVPEAWQNMPAMDSNLHAFYEYHSCLSEPWDGPAAIVFTDGRITGAALDRNGFRPARYVKTRSGLVIMASEAGVIDLNPADVIERGRLGPGQMIAIDTQSGAFYTNDTIKKEIATRRDYKGWVEKMLVPLEKLVERAAPMEPPPSPTSADFLSTQRFFGYSAEEVKLVLRPMYMETKEPTWSMGNDTALTVLSDRARLLYTCFKQRFAQVTNPPIDPLREKLVMSLLVTIGSRKSYLEESEEHARLVRLQGPILLDHELHALGATDEFTAVRIPTLYRAEEDPGALRKALDELCERATEAVDTGTDFLILSDRGVDAQNAAIPMLLAIGAVNQHLVRSRKRMRASLLVETAEAWDVHHMACLIGYGATAVNPYLAIATISNLIDEGISVDDAVENYRTSLDKGLLKIMSKMGISAISSYHGAQIFEALGVAQDVIDQCFTGTPSRLDGMGFEDLGNDVLERHAEAFGAQDRRLPNLGFYGYRRSGDRHAFNPALVKTLQKAVKTGDYQDYLAYSNAVNERKPIAIRDLLTLQSDRAPIPIDEVEGVRDIVRRFTSQAMSVGAISPETHKAISIAMNRLGARSNTGEGGEDPDWWEPLPNGDIAASKIKQIASGRFGVTPEYIARAEQLEIKMAQGAKPGEGGQLPKHKVTKEIARIRRAVVGIPLISPAPHHDIYSIEDIAQLIYDLKMANKEVTVCVKLVAEEGVGTIAAGVVKAYADVILISGHDGGTGASPISSIKNAGLPWELGLSETQQILVANNLRSRISLRVDGGLKTGRDVVVAACLGAEEFGFGTMTLVALGCVMTRQCHLNTCPVGVATQRPDLRARFTGVPEAVVHYFEHVAQEVRGWLADLGCRTLDEIVGRADYLQPTFEPGDIRTGALDLTAVTALADPTRQRPCKRTQPRNDRPDTPLDDQMVNEVLPRIARGERVTLAYRITNRNRSVGTRLAGEIARRHGDAGLPGGTIVVNLHGTAGQSLGAFNVNGISLLLSGEANDYVGKGMGGGMIVLRPYLENQHESHRNVILGNTALYGATGGLLFASGQAGERFAIRNSGAIAVVEGIGDHGCEYMTGGCVVVLGETGRNFGAGMSNGVAYIFDVGSKFESRFNPEMVRIERVDDVDSVALRGLIQEHHKRCDSPMAQQILNNWEFSLPRFWKVVPLYERPPEEEEEEEDEEILENAKP